ncbi:hypothetical protein P5G65_25160 [Paenibacillus chondroitinus]|uniref:Uncharacterized protein n=1 Tax=Paenibacillus chondroitinus TaxID=59842 RepID=A0ABU6DHQ4_9BACL|nr:MULTISPECIES: hypothetical protein [Paenibacillus]MCY9658487.1 hypothetical protein [Paenibacillus anseongense]MEB4797199.1 hypothetical protein [Paenibacillus chondroitinus]
MSLGNFGDVWKHAVLIELIDQIFKNKGKLHYVETHGSVMKGRVGSSNSGKDGIYQILKNFEVNCLNTNYINLQNFPTKISDDFDYYSSWGHIYKHLNKIINLKHNIIMDICEIEKEKYTNVINDINNASWNVNYKNIDGFKYLEELISRKCKPDIVFIDPFWKNIKLEGEFKDPNNNILLWDYVYVANAIKTMNDAKIDFIIWYPLYKNKMRDEVSEFKEMLSSLTLVNYQYDNGGKPSSQFMYETGMLFSKNLATFIPNIKQELSYFNNSINSWRVEKSFA